MTTCPACATIVLGPRIDHPDLEQLAERMHDAAELERFRRSGGALPRWTSIGQDKRDEWLAAARAAVAELARVCV